MSIQSDIKALASNLSLGDSGYYHCPKCSKPNKLGITHTVDGLVYQCFSASCGIRGKQPNPMSVSNMVQILNRKLIQHREASFELPNYLIDGFASENSLKMALKYDLVEAHTNGAFQTAYDPRLNRQVFFHTDKQGKVVGAMGRALSILQKPKAYIYPNTEKTPWVIGYNPVADNPTAVVVEDILSAVKIYNIGLCGIALSGTVLSPSYLSLFKKFSTIYVCLDNDASIKSFKVKRLLDICCENVIIRFIPKDFKDMTRTEAKEILHGEA